MAATDGKKVRRSKLSAPISLRVPQHVRSALIEAGAASGRGLSGEIAHRLDRSFFRDELPDLIAEAVARGLEART